MIPIGVQTGGITTAIGMDAGYRLIKEAGFDGVDANLDQLHPYRAIQNRERSSALDAANYLDAFRPWKEAAEKYGLHTFQAHAPHSSAMPGDEAYNDYLADNMKKVIEGCGYLGCKRLVIHPFFYQHDDQLEKQEEWELNLRRYSALIDTARENDVTICLENVFSRYRGKIYAAICSDMTEACRYVDALNDIAGERRFAFCLDIGHLLLASLDVKNAIVQLGDRIEALHVHDNNGIEDQHLMPYTGITDWDRFTEGLKAIGYRKPLSFETFNAMKCFDQALWPQVLSLIEKTGRMFASRI